MTPMTIQFTLPELPNLRDAAGRFTSEGIREQTQRNQQIATVLQGQVALRMRNHIAFGKRSSASTGRLLRATADGQNVVWDRWSLGVGRVDYLNKSVAKYWRTFEEGSAAVWTRPFIGTRLHQIGPYEGPSAHGQDLRTAKENFRYPDDSFMVVKQEIAPAGIYRQVFEEAHLEVSGYEAAFRYLNRIFGKDAR